MAKPLRFKDYSMTCLERFQMQEDQVDAVRQCALTFTALIEEALDLGVEGTTLAAAMEPMLRIVKRLT